MKQVAELIFLFYMGGRPSKESLDFFLSCEIHTINDFEHKCKILWKKQ